MRPAAAAVREQSTRTRVRAVSRACTKGEAPPRTRLRHARVSTGGITGWQNAAARAGHRHEGRPQTRGAQHTSSRRPRPSSSASSSRSFSGSTHTSSRSAQSLTRTSSAAVLSRCAASAPSRLACAPLWCGGPVAACSRWSTYLCRSAQQTLQSPCEQVRSKGGGAGAACACAPRHVADDITEALVHEFADVLRGSTVAHTEPARRVAQGRRHSVVRSQCRRQPQREGLDVVQVAVEAQRCELRVHLHATVAVTWAWARTRAAAVAAAAAWQGGLASLGLGALSPSGGAPPPWRRAPQARPTPPARAASPRVPPAPPSRAPAQARRGTRPASPPACPAARRAGAARP